MYVAALLLTSAFRYWPSFCIVWWPFALPDDRGCTGLPYLVRAGYQTFVIECAIVKERSERACFASRRKAFSRGSLIDMVDTPELDEWRFRISRNLFCFILLFCIILPFRCRNLRSISRSLFRLRDNFLLEKWPFCFSHQPRILIQNLV